MEGSCSGLCLWRLCPVWPFNVGLASWTMGESPSLEICPAPKRLGSLCGTGGVLFSASGVPPVEGF